MLSQETLIYKPISSLPPTPPPSPPPPPPPPAAVEQRGRGRQTPWFEGGPLLNASPSFGSIHLINSTPQVKFPSLPSYPPPPSPLYRPLLNASPSLGETFFIAWCSDPPTSRIPNRKKKKIFFFVLSRIRRFENSDVRKKKKKIFILSSDFRQCSYQL